MLWQYHDRVIYWCSSMKPVCWPRARLIFHDSQSHLCCPISWVAQGRLDQFRGCDQESHHPAEDTERRPVSINGHPRCLETEQNNLNLYRQTSGGDDRLDSVSSGALKHISRTTPPLTTFHLQLRPWSVWLTAVIASHALSSASRHVEQMCPPPHTYGEVGARGRLGPGGHRSSLQEQLLCRTAHQLLTDDGHAAQNGKMSRSIPSPVICRCNLGNAAWTQCWNTAKGALTC